MNVKPLLITASVGAFILSGCAQSGKTLPAESFVARTIPTGSARLHRVSLTELDAFFAKFPSAKRRRLRTVNQNQTGDGTNPTCDYGDASQGYCDKYGTDPSWMSTWETVPATGWGHWTTRTVCWSAPDCNSMGYGGYDVVYHTVYQWDAPFEAFPLNGRLLGGGDGDALVGYDDCQVAANLERIGYANRVQAAINRIKDPTNRPGYVNGISGFIQQLQTAWRATRFGQAKSDAEFYKHAGDFFQHSYPNLTTDEVELYNAMARYPAAASPDPTLSPFVRSEERRVGK